MRKTDSGAHSSVFFEKISWGAPRCQFFINFPTFLQRKRNEDFTDVLPVPASLL